MSTVGTSEGSAKAADTPPLKGASAPKVTAEVKFDIERFDGKKTDFAMWQCQMSDILVQQGLHRALLGNKAKPDEWSDADWAEYDRQACSTIHLHLAPNVMYFVMRETSASVIWKKLEDQYMMNSIENRLYLKKKLFLYEFSRGTSMNDHLDGFNTIILDLQGLDVEIDDEDKAILLLNSLSESYDHLTTTRIHGKEKVTYDLVSSAVLANEKCLKERGESNSDALFIRGRSDEKKQENRGKSRSKSRGPTDKSKIICHKCKKPGHIPRECPNRTNGGGENKGVVENANTNAVTALKDEDFESMLVVTSRVSSSSEWILDSGCSYHMCPNRELFHTFTEVDGSKVLMGNDHACKTMGIGTIRLKMHDGVVRTLRDVQYVPDLKKNLISLGVLHSNGYRVILEGGNLKVLSEAMVVMRGNNEGNLYFLQGSTVIGFASVTTEEIDTTRLWHMRLGHDGEKAMTVLSKQGLLEGAKSCKLEFCEHCVLEKQTRVKFGTAVHCTKGALDYVHTDVWGPTKTQSLGGNHYFMTFVDDYSRRTWVYLMKHKDQVFDVFLK
ncbi:hypothetical protein LguiA_025568 [Lonicera macranthoides]